MSAQGDSRGDGWLLRAVLVASLSGQPIEPEAAAELAKRLALVLHKDEPLAKVFRLSGSGRRVSPARANQLMTAGCYALMLRNQGVMEKVAIGQVARAVGVTDAVARHLVRSASRYLPPETIARFATDFAENPAWLAERLSKARHGAGPRGINGKRRRPRR